MASFFSNLKKKLCDRFCNGSEKRIENNKLKIAINDLNRDFKNYRDRVKRDNDKNSSLATSELILDLLPVLDSLDECYKNSSDEGILSIKKLMDKVLKSSGLEEIKSKNEKFNPDFHEAIGEIKSEEADQDKILEVVRKGYKIGDRVIRAALVKIGSSK